jgi:hypothetical protein
VFGVFRDLEDPSVIQTPGKAPIAFLKSEIETAPSQQVFLASASPQAISEVVIFAKEYRPGSTMLCGLKIEYSDLNHALLGEDGEERQSVLLRNPIQSIHVHYTQFFDVGWVVTGLNFNTGCKNKNVGNCDSQTMEILEIDQVGQALTGSLSLTLTLSY